MSIGKRMNMAKGNRKLLSVRRRARPNRIVYVTKDKLPTICKIGRFGNSVAILGKNDTRMELSSESIKLIGQEIGGIKRKAKISTYGLSRSEIGQIVHDLTSANGKQVTILNQSAKSEPVAVEKYDIVFNDEV